MHPSLNLSCAAILVVFLITAGCTSNSAGTPTPTPVPPTPVVTETTAPACPAGTASCPDGSCQNTTTDNRNCGGCGNVCPPAFVCLQSQCVNTGTNVIATPYPHT